MKTRVTINLNDFVKAKKFTTVAESFESDIDVVRGRYVIDAKSTLGIFTLDLSKPIDVEIHSADEHEIKRFNDVIKEFVINE